MFEKANAQADQVSPAQHTENLSEHLNNILDKLNELLEITQDGEAANVMLEQRSTVRKWLEKETLLQIDQATPLYSATIEDLKKATKSAEDAKEDINKLAAAIDEIVKVTTTIDKIAQLGTIVIP
jgi:methyl-accepting chemotaxis protein